MSITSNSSGPLIAPGLRRFSTACALVAVMFFIADFIGVVFLGGINLTLGPASIRSTTLEFPTIGLLVSVLIWLLVSGRTKESLLSICSLILALGVIELGLRIVDHPLSRPLINFNRWYEPSELYGHQLVKSFEGLGPLQVPVKINSQGFRDAEHPPNKGNGTIRILGLGDSFTFGWGVHVDQTYLKQLEQGLHHALNHSVETINTGVPGWGLNQYYLYLKEAGLKLAPDVVLLGYFIDDLTGPPVDKLEASQNSQWQGGGGSPDERRTLSAYSPVQSLYLLRRYHQIPKSIQAHLLSQRCASPTCQIDGNGRLSCCRSRTRSDRTAIATLERASCSHQRPRRSTWRLINHCVHSRLLATLSSGAPAH